MKRETLFSLLLALGLLLVLGGGMMMAHRAQAQGPEPQAATSTLLSASVGTAFTYQGYLKDANGPVNGTCNFTFTLHDALTDGNQVGSVTKPGEQVSDGYFSVDLDFGAGKFTGDARYLQIAVNCGSGATTLSPRVALNPVPYALFSVEADLLDGQQASAFAPASHTHSGSEYQNVVIVAKSGGDYTSIQAALDSISDASDTNRYLVWVGPGTYTERVTMKPYVDIEGAGELVTKITYTGSVSDNTGTVVGANDAELRFLTVENTGGSNFAIAVYNNGASPRLTHVTATASTTGTASNNYGMYNTNSSSPTMTNVTASASGGSASTGVENTNSSSPMMTNVTASASGGFSYNYGVYNNSSSPTMTNVTASASGGGNGSRGVHNWTSAPTMMNVTASASGGTGFNIGLDNFESSPTVQNSVLSASGGTTSYGISNTSSSGTHTVKVDNSKIKGSDSTIHNDSNFTTYVGASQLDGGAVTGGGTVGCYGCYDEVYTNAGGVNVCP